MGIGALPAAGDGGTVEVDEQMVARSRLKEIHLIVHVGLRVACKEIDLHACYSQLMTPGKLTFAVLRLVQAELWTWSAVNPPYRRVVPDHGLHTLLVGIGQGIGHAVTVLHLVPFGIDEHIGKVQGGGHVDVLTNDIEVVGAVIVSPIYP